MAKIIFAYIVCFRIVLEALTRLKDTEDWVKNCWLWMYRGARDEFENTRDRNGRAFITFEGFQEKKRHFSASVAKGPAGIPGR